MEGPGSQPLREELNDLSASNGIVVALNGCTADAQRAAAQCGIELWGPDELAERLGRVVLAELNVTGAAPVIAQGFPFSVSEADARSAAERAGRGRLGVFGAEELVWLAPVWLPVHLLQIGLTYRSGGIKKVAQVERRWNVYDAVNGKYMFGWAAQPTLSAVDVRVGALQASIKPAPVAKAIMSTYERWRSVTTPAAKDRHAASLLRLGIAPLPMAIGIEDTRSAHFPIWAAILCRGGGERVAALSGRSGNLMESVSQTLTGQIGWTRSSLSD